MKVLIIANQRGITSNPVPMSFRNDNYVCYGDRELRHKLEGCMNGSIKSYINSKKVLKSCFEEVNGRNVMNFIKNIT